MPASSEQRSIAWVPDVPQRALLGALPASVDLRVIPRDHRGAAERGEVRIVVPPTGDAALARDVIASLPAVELVQALSAGVDPLVAAVPPTAQLCSARGARDGAVAEWILAAILGDARHVRAAVEHQLAGHWRPIPGRDVRGSRVLILGYGSIGETLATPLRLLGAEVVAIAHRARPGGVHAIEALPSLLADVDTLVNLLPLTPATHRLVDADVLARLPHGALLVNAGRGATVDTDALVARVRAGALRAVLDVTDPEPLPAGHPLWSLPDVLITAHVAGGTPGATDAAWRLAGDQLRRFARGEPLRNVAGQS